MRFGKIAVNFFVLLITCLCTTVSVRAQNMPRIGYVYPAGGQQGTNFQITIGGQFLDSVTNVYVTGWGVRAKILEFTKPLTQQQFNNLRDEQKALQEKRAAFMKLDAAEAEKVLGTNRWTDADEKALAEVRKKLMNPPNRFGNPAIAEKVTVQIEIAAAAEAGERELRVRTAQGLSNPRIFRIGQLPEFSQPAAKSVRINRYQEQEATPPTETSVSLPTIINGQIMPGGVDRYRFKAVKGTKLVAAASARELIPYLSDAVPGWFQAALTLSDAHGQEIRHADHFEHHPDPVLYYEIPEDGEYVLQINDSIYRGREDFVYRLALGEIPYVTGIFPLGGKAGEQTEVKVEGWNLSTNTIQQDNRKRTSGIYSFFAENGKLLSNPVAFAVDSLPECFEKEPNNEVAKAQVIKMPIMINGRISKPGEWDVFQVQGRRGEVLVAEVYARRLDSPLDSVLRVTDASGKQLAYNDDNEDKGSGLNTHHADSRLSITFPDDGSYYIHLGDAQHNGGEAYTYRLRLSQPQPDFALRVVPSSVNLKGGASVPLTVYALRKDGFSNQIEVVLKNAPSGFAINGGIIPANEDKVQITLNSSAAPSEPVSLSFEGRAKIGGRVMAHPALPAEDMMQAFLYRHLVPSKNLFVDVTGRFSGRYPVSVLSPTPVKLIPGTNTIVRVSMPQAIMNRMDLELCDPPEGLSLGKISTSAKSTDIQLVCDATKWKVGNSGNLIIQLAPRGKGKGQGNASRGGGASLPAIPYVGVRQGE